MKNDRKKNGMSLKFTLFIYLIPFSLSIRTLAETLLHPLLTIRSMILCVQALINGLPGHTLYGLVLIHCIRPMCNHLRIVRCAIAKLHHLLANVGDFFIHLIFAKETLWAKRHTRSEYIAILFCIWSQCTRYTYKQVMVQKVMALYKRPHISLTLTRYILFLVASQKKMIERLVRIVKCTH